MGNIENDEKIGIKKEELRLKYPNFLFSEREWKLLYKLIEIKVKQSRDDSWKFINDNRTSFVSIFFKKFAYNIIPIIIVPTIIGLLLLIPYLI